MGMGLRSSGGTAGGGLTVFALAGGANLGAVQVGMLAALLEAGIRPDAVIGTSAGALNAAYLAADPTPGGMERLAELWGSVRRREVFPLSLGGLTRALLARRNFFFPSVGLRRVIGRAQLGFARLENAPIPLHVVATDLDTGEAVVLSEGPVIDALLASAAIPGVFPPVQIGGRLLVDGGVVASIPILQAEALGASRIYVLPTLPEWVSLGASSPLFVAQLAIELASHPAVHLALERVAARTEVHVLPVPGAAARLSMFDFRATRRLIDEAHELTTAWLGRVPAPIPALDPAWAAT
jgi:NTE family protein